MATTATRIPVDPPQDRIVLDMDFNDAQFLRSLFGGMNVRALKNADMLAFGNILNALQNAGLNSQYKFEATAVSR